MVEYQIQEFKKEEKNTFSSIQIKQKFEEIIFIFYF